MIALKQLDAFRLKSKEEQIGGPGFVGDDDVGCFLIPSDEAPGVNLQVIAGNGAGWDHVSVTTSRKRCATWAEMEQIKRLFFREHEVAMQLHMPPSDHINNHPFCLHIWRPHFANIPVPPPVMV